MSDYTPTTEEIIEHWSAVRGQAIDPAARDRHLERAEMFRRWLTAHDAEKRAEWEAEQGIEYGVRLHPRIEHKTGVNQAPWTPPTMPTPTMERAREIAGLNPACRATFHSRRKAGPWVPVDENGSAER